MTWWSESPLWSHFFIWYIDKLPPCAHKTGVIRNNRKKINQKTVDFWEPHRLKWHKNRRFIGLIGILTIILSRNFDKYSFLRIRTTETAFFQNIILWYKMLIHRFFDSKNFFNSFDLIFFVWLAIFGSKIIFREGKDFLIRNSFTLCKQM